MKIPYAFENLPVNIPGNLVANGNIFFYSWDIFKINLNLQYTFSKAQSGM